MLYKCSEYCRKESTGLVYMKKDTPGLHIQSLNQIQLDQLNEKLAVLVYITQYKNRTHNGDTLLMFYIDHLKCLTLAHMKCYH